jgi:hypothetical protein
MGHTPSLHSAPENEERVLWPGVIPANQESVSTSRRRHWSRPSNSHLPRLKSRSVVAAAGVIAGLADAQFAREISRHRDAGDTRDWLKMKNPMRQR